MPTICPNSKATAMTCPRARRGNIGGATPTRVRRSSWTSNRYQVCLSSRKWSQAQQPDVVAFLQQVGLEKHASTLLANGFDDVETLLAISEDDLKTFEDLEDLQVPLQDLLALKAQSFRDHQHTSSARICSPSTCVQGADLLDKTVCVDKSSVAEETNIMPSWLTDERKQLLKTSWHQLQLDKCEQAGALLCRHYCSQSPQDAASCGMDWSAVIKVIGFPLDRLDSLTFVRKRLGKLGANHAKWGTKEHQFHSMKSAFLAALRDVFADDYTSDLELAWGLLYEFVSNEMIAGLKQI